jgi:hypothetical protein
MIMHVCVLLVVLYFIFFFVYWIYISNSFWSQFLVSFLCCHVFRFVVSFQKKVFFLNVSMYGFFLSEWCVRENDVICIQKKIVFWEVWRMIFNNIHTVDKTNNCTTSITTIHFTNFDWDWTTWENKKKLFQYLVFFPDDINQLVMHKDLTFDFLIKKKKWDDLLTISHWCLCERKRRKCIILNP